MATDHATLAQPFDLAFQEIHTKQRGLWAQAMQRLVRNRLALVSGVLLAIIIAVAVLGNTTDIVRRHPPAAQQYQQIDAPPSAEYWLGTDSLGRDNWSRLMQATLFSLKIGIGAEAVRLLIGVVVGMGAALGRRWADGILMWFTDLTYAFPDLLAIILLRQILWGRDWPIIGTGDPQLPGMGSVLLVTIIAISWVNWTGIARLVRGQMLSIREQDYVTAAVAVGAGPWRTVRSHMLPNTLSTVIVAVTFGIPTAIFAEAALSFIGLGVPPPDASLGSLVIDGYDHLQTNHLLVLWPCIMIATIMLCFTFLGDGLRDALDPRTRK